MKSNNEENFGQLIDNNRGIIYKVANSYCQNTDERKDLIQEIMVQLWRSYDKYDDNFKVSTWMYRIALNVAISFYRKQSRMDNFIQVDVEALLLIPKEADPEYSDEKIKQLYRFIASLNKLNKAIMLLYLEDESYKTIAQSLGITETNVATKISRIKKMLKQQFTDTGEDNGH